MCATVYIVSNIW